MRQRAWHVLPWLEVAKILKVHPEKGLDLREVKRRLTEFGRNILTAKKKINPVFYSWAI